ncbi:unnamed protein product [Periconia digitata]|uniref:Uncharacterized protein n=1 Tax=Periconia digitata TaxID=1303443 RepID=A0A9W4UBY5_9PLEO|nr:unnamed protein product [Periconia digitata]
MSVAMENRYPQPDQQSARHPPQSDSRPETRPRSKSTISFKSGKSAKSGGHSRKESHDEKLHLHAHTKADPNAAMNESQPSKSCCLVFPRPVHSHNPFSIAGFLRVCVSFGTQRILSHLHFLHSLHLSALTDDSRPVAAALEKPTLQSLRSFDHTDAQGNLIAEPDISNPTRSRWERPLDTIRSFEAAIDGEYRRRAHTMRADSNTEIMSQYGSRRSSYYGGAQDQNRYSQMSGYYGNRQAARDSWMDNAQGAGGPVGGPPRTRYNRMQSDPYNRYSNGHTMYPNQGYQQSRDTVNTNGSNGSHSDPYSTDPHSDNSSVERAPPVRQPETGEQYGFTGFGAGPILEENGQQRNSYFAQPPSNGNGHGVPPVPQKNGPPPPPVHGQPIKLTKTNGSNGSPAANSNSQARPNAEKRKSWFKRRFSKD